MTQAIRRVLSREILALEGHVEPVDQPRYRIQVMATAWLASDDWYWPIAAANNI